MLKASIIFIILTSSILVQGNTGLPEYISPSCELSSEIDVLDQSHNSYELSFNNRTFIKEIFKKFSSKVDKKTLQLSLSEPYKKKWIKAFFSISSGNKTCKYKAKIKIIGDLSDHYRLSPNSIEHSLLLKLDDANINKNTAFRLFIPQARQDDNELFGSLIYKKMGFLAPRTYKIPISINGNVSPYIFQEEINKEFLENNYRSEGLIFEGNEILGLSQKVSLPRIVNSKWSVNSKESKLISMHSLDVLNNVYLSSNSDGDLPISIGNLIDTSKSLKNKEILKGFFTLSYAMNGTHGLSRDDSRFYFNSVYGEFEPIYYDQSISLHTPVTYKKIDKNIKENLSLTQKKLDLINKDDLYKELKQKGFSRNKNYFNQLVINLYKNITALDSLPVQGYEYKDNSKKEISEYVQDIPIFGSFISFFNDNFLELEVCNKNFVNCYIKSLDTENIKEIFSQRLMIDKSKYSSYLNLDSLKTIDYPLSIYSFKYKNIENDVYLRYTDNLIINIDSPKKEIVITSLDKKKIGRAVFHSGKLSNWTISFEADRDYLNKNANSKFSLSGLTGCLNFHDIELQDVVIKAHGSNCEDAVHFMRAKGYIAKLFVTNSLHDGVDMDFSNINVSYLEINNSGNDCLDLSAGLYDIHKISLDLCGDKAISAGEQSFLSNELVKVTNSLYGAAAKDSSVIQFKEGFVDSKAACILAFRKKQEFNGARVDMGNIICKNNILFFSEGSLLEASTR